MVYCGAQKMSKSLGNMIFLSDLAAEYPPDAVRLYLMSHHYRRAWNYEPQELELANSLARTLIEAVSGVVDADEEELSRFSEPFLAALAQDLDTPSAIRELKTLAKNRDSSARRALRTLSSSILGLSFNPS